MTSSIGNTLKEARTRKAISLEEVHAKIKIHPRVLQLLEENKFDKLPSPLFVRSFLRSYANFLDVNADDVVHAYEKESGNGPEQTLHIKTAKERLDEEEPRRVNWRAWRLPALVVVFLVFIAGAVQGFSLLGQWWTARQNEAVPAAGTSAPSQGAIGWVRSREQGNFPNLVKGTLLELQIKAKDHVWLRITCDGKVLFQSILKRGSTESWSAKQSIEIWTGNSSNMVLTLNGTLLGSPGRGVVKKMTITHQGLKIPE